MELSFVKSKTVTYLLIEKKAEDNITLFSKLLINKKENKKAKCLFFQEFGTKNHLFPISLKDKEPRTKIFAFVQEEHESDTIHHILNSSDIKDQIAVRAIRDYMNAAINLMARAPLFLPLLYSSTNKTELNITIIGSGSIAKEVFKAIYWCGQMEKVKLNITVVSNNASSMEKHMSEFYAEMMECCTAGSSKLRIYENDTNSSTNPPYLESIHFVDIDDVTILSSYQSVLRQTDYYVIALGSDSLNHKVTSIISYELSLLRLKKQSGILQDGCPENVVIVPAIFDTELAKSIQKSKTVLRDGQILLETIIIPFATFKGRFSCQNVFFTSFIDDALSTQYLYAKKQSGKCANDEYSWMADIVREVHVPYKLYGIEKLKKANSGDDITTTPYIIDGAYNIEVSPDKYHVMAWIEHRRWNAFLRSQGFSCPDWKMFDCYCNSDNNNHKNISLKLHPCLVESSKTPTPRIDLGDDPSVYEHAPHDRLDYASMRIYHTRHRLDLGSNVPENERFNLPSKSGYKAYDYYGYYVGFESQNDRNETIIDWQWEANDSKLNNIINSQLNDSSSWNYP